MGLVVGENSYVDVAEADAYYADRLGAEKWGTYIEKESALITAATLLDSLCQWYGYPTDPDQEMVFPQDGETEVPKDIKTAQLEICLEMVNQDASSFTMSSEVLSKLKAGSVTLEWFQSQFVIPVVNSVAKSLLIPYGMCSFGGNDIIQVYTRR